ncbi:MAG: hypothetical protein CNCCGFBP_01572 [Fimbriimonadaceae bacterium]|nr:hypothetical protein [Fimbriimonadaceae bacterium]
MIEIDDTQTSSDDTVPVPTIEELETQWWEPLSCECDPGPEA